MSTFDFSTLYTKITHDKLFAVLTAITEFAFRVGSRNIMCIFNNITYSIENKSKMNGNRYSMLSL